MNFERKKDEIRIQEVNLDRERESIESRLRLHEQYDSQINLLRSAGLLERLSSGREGIKGPQKERNTHIPPTQTSRNASSPTRGTSPPR